MAIHSSCSFIFCLDDITDNAHLVIFLHYTVGNNIKEEIISLTSSPSATKGTDIYNSVVNILAEKEIVGSEIVTTDGARNMTGKVNGLVSFFAYLAVSYNSKGGLQP